MSSWRVGATFAVVAAVGVGCFFVGRLSAPARTGSYLAGYTDGQIAGVQQGRAIQGSQSILPADAKSAQDAYKKGYADGENDAFILQFDGGWKLNTPYIVTVSGPPATSPTASPCATSWNRGSRTTRARSRSSARARR